VTETVQTDLFEQGTDLEHQRQQPRLLFIPPGNQSAAHWFLCDKARCLLLFENAWYCGLEVPVDRHIGVYSKSRMVDVLGVGLLYHAASRSQVRVIRDGLAAVSTAVEVKISRADFRSGYLTEVADFNYLCAPEGLVKAKELPDHMGLLQWQQRDGIAELRRVRRARRAESPMLPGEAGLGFIASANAREMKNRVIGLVPDPFAARDRDDRRHHPYMPVCGWCEKQDSLRFWLHCRDKDAAMREDPS
jgi:hypothetical protein